jgi:hypothetical protein
MYLYFPDMTRNSVYTRAEKVTNLNSDFTLDQLYIQLTCTLIMNFPENKDSFLLRCHSTSTGKELPTFRRNVVFCQHHQAVQEQSS